MEPRDAGSIALGEATRKREETPESLKKTATRRTFLLVAEASLILGILAVVLFSESVKESTSLWVLFVYSFPSEFLVGLIPHEPVLIYYGTLHDPWVVATVAIISTVMAEGLNYSFFGLFYEIPAFHAALQRDGVRKVADLFARMPFAAILFAGFSPVPFFPVRFLVVITRYPVWKYLLGVFVARAPRFYLLALFGAFFEVPTLVLVAFFLVMLFMVNLPGVAKVMRS